MHVDGEQRQLDHDDVLGQIGEPGDLLAFCGGQFGQLVVPGDLIGERAVVEVVERGPVGGA